MRAELQDPSRYTAFVTPVDQPETPCAYVMLHDKSVRTGDKDGRPEDYLELKRFYVDKQFHGMGIAQLLMDHTMQVIKDKQQKESRRVVWLGVWENNIRAQKFYQKYGFRECGEHVFLVGTVEDRDLLYELTPQD
ncbi:hypothetical protein P43SY_009351 [Pythium insidiosum]|uniref:N-acetyltransferase domain-containing protein n=1 Tax=Pythium insidiosum TaxID=114742 RepID=A0AAD5MD24_PYTIN|nr:hypothetical protein P43SY_009351 [Pythium insidiosum]